MTLRPVVLALALAAVPAAGAAQSAVNGVAEWTVSSTRSTTDQQASHNGAFWQNYTVGYHSSFLDPRLVRYDAEASFRTNAQKAGGDTIDHRDGHQRDVGFRLGASALPLSAFPFYVQASRVFTGSSGELALSNPIRGALAGSGAMSDTFETEDRELSLGTQLRFGNLPRGELTYRRAQSMVTGLDQEAGQRNGDLTASLLKEGRRVRHALRYQRSAYDYILAQAFTYNFNNLDYDFSAQLSAHTRVTGRAGQRSTFSHSDLVEAAPSPGDKPYEPPPTDGRNDVRYATSGVAYEPNARVAMYLNASFDDQSSMLGATNAALGTTSAHVEVLRGLLVDASATAGRRGQRISDELTTVSVASGVAGLTYRGGTRWLGGSVSASRGLGTNQTPEGARGRTESWSSEASVTSTIGWFGVGGGYERVNNRDEILDYGNYASERIRGSLQALASRYSMTASADQVDILRGAGDTLAANRQRNASLTVSARTWRNLLLTASGGGFLSTYASDMGEGLDRSVYWGGGAQLSTMRSLNLTAWVRDETTTATGIHLRQHGLSALGRIEYRLRTILLTLEYRHSNSMLRYELTMPEPSLFTGHQLRFSLTRQFGMVL